MTNPTTKPGVSEIVSFHLSAGVTAAAIVALAATSAEFVTRQPGFVGRRLSKGADGRWTDYVLWSDMDAAQAAGALYGKQSFAEKQISAIAKEAFSMRHETIHWQQT